MAARAGKQSPTGSASWWQRSQPHRWLALPALVVLFRLWTLPRSSFGWYHGFNEALYTTVALGVGPGHWIPVWHGRLFFDTPPLATYTMALFLRVLGTSEFAARLPSVIAMVAMLVGVWLAALRLFGRAAAKRAVCYAATAPWVLLWFGRAQTDPYLASAVALCIAGLVNLDRRWGFATAAASFALGIMAKQPMLVVAVAVPFLGAQKKRGALALAVGLAVPVLFWLLAFATHSPEVLDSFRFHATERTPWFANMLNTLTLGTLLGAGSFLLLVRPDDVKWHGAVLAPAVALIVFAVAQSPDGHEYYTLPAIPLLAVHAAQSRIGPRAAGVFMAVNAVVAIAVLGYFGDIGDERAGIIGRAIPDEGTYVPYRLGPQMEFYAGHGVQWYPGGDTAPVDGAHIVSFRDQSADCALVRSASYNNVFVPGATRTWGLYRC